MRDLLEITIVFAFVILVAVAGLIIPSVWIDSISCQKIGELAGKETKYSALTCFVEHEGSYITLKQYNNTFIAPEKK